jgi:hypothetical protein
VREQAWLSLLRRGIQVNMTTQDIVAGCFEDRVSPIASRHHIVSMDLCLRAMYSSAILWDGIPLLERYCRLPAGAVEADNSDGVHAPPYTEEHRGVPNTLAYHNHPPHFAKHNLGPLLLAHHAFHDPCAYRQSTLPKRDKRAPALRFITLETQSEIPQRNQLTLMPLLRSTQFLLDKRNMTDSL